MSNVDYKNYLPTHYHASVHDDSFRSVDHMGYQPLYTQSMLQQKIHYFDTRRLREINHHLAVRRDNVRNGGVDNANTFRDDLGLDNLTALGRTKQRPLKHAAYNPFDAAPRVQEEVLTVPNSKMQRQRWEEQVEKQHVLDAYHGNMRSQGIKPRAYVR